nr:GNAT family N-acetyltransferase [Aliiroseovarius subalbicans]
MSGWIDETPWMPRVHTCADEQGFARMLVDKGWTSVARRCGVPVGFLARDGGAVHALYLAPGVRGQGVGKALLDRAKAETRALALYTFQANAGAQRFYLREGFSEVARTDGARNDENLPDIRYEWRAP